MRSRLLALSLMVALSVAITTTVVVTLARSAPKRKPAERVLYAVLLAAAAYELSADAMLRVARCESELDPRARNPNSGASGLFQFLGSTWKRTPFARFDRKDPYASALAAGWLVRQDGGWSEWASECRP